MQYEVILAIIAGGLLGFYYLKTRQNTPKYLKLKLGDQSEIIKGLKTEAKSWKGKFHARNAGPVLEKEPSDDITQVIPELARSYAPNAPNWLKPLLDDPEIIKWAMNLAKEHPEQAKNWLSKFVKKQSTDPKQEKVSGL